MYIFEIAEVVPDPAFSSKRWYKLRLRCRDDAKGPVTAVCGFSGYLVSSMGQKVSCDRVGSFDRVSPLTKSPRSLFVHSTLTSASLELLFLTLEYTSRHSGH